MATSEVVFSTEFRVKVGVTISNKYQIQLKESICCRKNPKTAIVGFL